MNTNLQVLIESFGSVDGVPEPLQSVTHQMIREEYGDQAARLFSDSCKSLDGNVYVDEDVIEKLVVHFKKLDRLPKSGVYRLTQAVPNPNKDARVRYDWTRAQEIPAGLYVIRRNQDKLSGPSVWIDAVTNLGRRQGYISCAGIGHPILEAMLPYLATETHPNALGLAATHGLDNLAWPILQRLLDSGTVSADTYEAILTKIEEENTE